jgi:hypothetical protein
MVIIMARDVVVMISMPHDFGGMVIVMASVVVRMAPAPIAVAINSVVTAIVAVIPAIISTVSAAVPTAVRVANVNMDWPSSEMDSLSARVIGPNRETGH